MTTIASPEKKRKEGQHAMNSPPIVSRQEWKAAWEQLLVKEKAQTRARDALVAERRRMPWTRHTHSMGPGARRACSTCSRAAVS